ncbi:hypothetical protein BD770DRAFT_330959 [Pilaira anomala]|nr:hypothetical protein BD770DRAFT_330959 [Pilaira anomala]
MYRQTIDSLSIRRCSSFTASSIRELEDDGYLSSSGRCPTIDTTNEEKEDRDLPPHTTITTAHSNIFESIFDLFSCSLYLENNAAVARDHLANERTYLAWVRTSLSTISIGVAITQLFRLDKNVFEDPKKAEELATMGRPLGLTFVVIGMAYLIFAIIRYFHSQTAMTKGYFPASRGIVILSSSATFIALVVVFISLAQKQ